MIGLQAIADKIQKRWRLGNWDIEVKEMPADRRQDEDGTKYYGLIDTYAETETAIIYINPEMSEHDARHTLFHEMIHLRLEGHDTEEYYERGIDLIAKELAYRG